MTHSAQDSNRTGAEAAPPAACHAPAAEARRREIMTLLEEIRSDQPSPGEVLNAIRRASNGELTAERLHRIAGSVLALYR